MKGRAFWELDCVEVSSKVLVNVEASSLLLVVEVVSSCIGLGDGGLSSPFILRRGVCLIRFLTLFCVVVYDCCLYWGANL